MDFDDGSDSPSTKPHPDDFMEYLPFACLKFGINIYVEKVHDEIDNSRLEKKKLNGKSRTRLVLPAASSQPLAVKSAPSVGDDFAIRIMAKFNGELLTHLIFSKQTKTIPWEILRLMCEIIHFHPSICSITMNSGLDEYCLHELSKLVSMANITELYLDNTFVKSAKYSTLLSQSRNLQVLSLARCKIGDNGMQEIIEYMESPHKAHYTLTALNVSSNALTDKTATHLAQMLRSNRKLTYLNLNGNRITTIGGVLILKVLTKFPMTDEELKNYRDGWLKYLFRRQELIDDFCKRYTPKVTPSSKKDSTKKPMRRGFYNAEMDEKEKLDRMASEYAENELGAYEHPFHVPLDENGQYYCTGNNCLAYLGLGYNSITFPFLTALTDILQYQRSYFFTRKQKGLVNIKLEGNLLPTSCQELKDIDFVLTMGLLNQSRQRKSVVSKPLKKL